MKLRMVFRAQWDRAAGFGLVLAGAGLLLSGYVGVSGSDTLRDALSYLVSGGLFGVTLVAAGLALLVSADLHDEWRKLDRIEAAIRESGPAGGREIDLVPPSARPARIGAAEGALSGGQRALAVTRTDTALRSTAVIGAVGLALALTITWGGFARTSGAGELDAAWGGIGLAVAGIALAFMATGAYPARLRGAIMRRRAAVFAPWSTDAPTTGVTAGRSGCENDTTDGVVFVGDGQSRFHRKHCAGLEGRDVTAAALADLDPSLQACGLCDPTAPSALT